MFIETTIDGKSTIIGVIYRVPIANEEESIRYFEKIIAPIHGKNTDVIIGTFQNFDFLIKSSTRMLRLMSCLTCYLQLD